MSKYKHLFFDLDRTLWDFETNSLLTLEEIFEKHGLGIPSFSSFLKFYKKYNHQLWEEYKAGAIEKEYLSVERFNGTLQHFSIQDFSKAKAMALDYVQISPQKTKLFPDAHMVLSYLSKRYQLHIITNGFNEVQFVKLKNSKLDSYFTHIITSEMLGIQKPNIEIFKFALKQADASVNESVMIGDDQLTDIAGARNVGMDQVFVNFINETLIGGATYEINSLKELMDIF
ncbi:MAG: noncanonical pyrimidine nucleotidase, YjjG family [Bacteroidetes bacterium 4572_77]|nr:MAG: noncanonical pyrimidine nucleotidase, YjjG family [Bacteroidetes bacterium 4572_77]